MKSLTAFMAALICNLAWAGDPCDLDRGESMYTKCAICHSVTAEEGHTLGPNLAGVIGRDIGAFEDFPYSIALEAKAGIWTEAALDEFMENPMANVPGTTMGFAGLRKPEDRAALICYLSQYN